VPDMTPPPQAADRAEEAPGARRTAQALHAVQVALDRRDNGGAAGASRSADGEQQ
jgi:hypothetical protein